MRCQLGNHKAAVLEIRVLELLKQLWVFATCLRDSVLQYSCQHSGLSWTVCLDTCNPAGFVDVRRYWYEHAQVAFDDTNFRCPI